MPTSLLPIHHYIERSKYSLGLTPIAWLMIRQYVLYPDLLATIIPYLLCAIDHTSNGLDVLNIPAPVFRMIYMYGKFNFILFCHSVTPLYIRVLDFEGIMLNPLYFCDLQ